jgi:transcriptional regulator with XRE-family HTH domain
MPYYYKEKEVLKMNYTNDSNLGNKTVFSENIKYYLSKTGEMQRDIAKAAGVSEATVCDWIKRRTYPRMDKIQLLAEHWEIQISDLVEERSIENQYYLQKESKVIATVLAQNPDTLVMFQNFQKLSPENREIVKAMINSLAKGAK